MTTITENNFCRVCLTKDESENNDIRQLKFSQKPAVEVFEYLFGIKINVSSLDHKKVPRKICEGCQDDVRHSLSLAELVSRSHGIIEDIDLVETSQIKEEPPLDIDDDVVFEIKQEELINEEERPVTVQQKAVKIATNRKTKSQEKTVLKEKRFCCAHCPLKVRNKNQLLPHLRKHFNIRNYKCAICEKSFFLSADLKNHLRTHTKEKPFRCKICERSFAMKATLKKHFKTHTKSFAIETTLDCPRRLGTHAKGTLLKCAFCLDIFTSRRKFNSHIFLHTGKTPYQCEICLKFFKRNDGLQYHRGTKCWLLLEKKANQNKKFKCAHCTATFSKKHSLSLHVQTHFNFRNYKCKLCEKSFTQSSSLNTHILTHTSEKPLKCKICSQFFTQSKGLNIHLRQVHPSTELEKR